MFENLTGRLSDAARNLSGKGRLTEANIKDTLRQVRLALLEADVALPVVKTFIERIRERAVGEEVAKSLTPGQALVKIIHNELVAILGGDHAPLNLKAQPPAVAPGLGLTQPDFSFLLWEQAGSSSRAAMSFCFMGTPGIDLGNHQAAGVPTY